MQRCPKTPANGVPRHHIVETMRRYSKLPHLWRRTKRLAKLLTSSAERSAEPSPVLPHVHKLSQRLSDQTVKALLSDYRDGSSLADLQRKYSLGRGSVQRLLREAGLRRRRKSLTDAELAALVERYEAGLPIREIAAEQGLAKTTVRDALKRSEVGMRSAARIPSAIPSYRAGSGGV
jgi:DNA-directed RNA polymerase specialized sigma24 family protein